ncbi:MAG: hypothetical protein GY951_05740 [Psychromonas sp.]|nr:hypothetical protein [Psychromonas sp.]
MDELKKELIKELDNDIRIFVISAVTRAGCKELSYEMYDWVEQQQNQETQ